jgi:hypothetical protein
LAPLAAMAALVAAAPRGAESDAELIARAAREPPPGEGAICALALFAAAAEVGRRCFPDERPALQAELDRASARLDAFVLANSRTSRAELDELKRKQALVGAPQAELCASDAMMIYRAFAAQGADALKADSEKLVTRPGPATWGDCL